MAKLADAGDSKSLGRKAVRVRLPPRALPVRWASLIIKVKVKPNAKKNEVKRIEENFFEVRTTVVPEKGKANKKTIELLSKYLNIPKSRIKLIKGETSREKIFDIDGE